MFPITRFRISDRSMLPNFKEGDYVLVLKIYFSLKSGDVIVFERNGKFLIKRIEQITNGKYFVAGDNRRLSKDSRHFGPITKEQIIGKVLIKIQK